MIDELDVSNLALIESAMISPSPSMTVITGETGAGKTALLAACRLIMGQRADRDMIREGADCAEVEARLYVDDRTFSSSIALDGEANNIGEQQEIVASRSVSLDGRPRVRINGKMASVSELSDIVAPTISLCSQHDQIMLTRPSMHRVLLDTWAQIPGSTEFQEYVRAYDEVQKCARELTRLESDSLVSDAKLEEARFKLRQIDSVNPTQEDYDELIDMLNKSQNAELLARTSSESSAALSGEAGALDMLNAAISSLEEGSRVDSSMGERASTLREALYIVEDVARDCSKFEGAFDFDAASVDLAQERISAYQSLLRMYGPTIEDVIAEAARARRIVNAVDDSDDEIARVRERLDAASLILDGVASALHERRAEEAPKFSHEMDVILDCLGMGNSEFICNVDMLDCDDWTESGPDDVRFMFVPAPGMQPRPLSKIASGGELGRVMLALHVSMGERDSVDTLVFDEVDAGVGGAIANDVGDVMLRSAKTHQVIVVTHNAQIAARADKHYVVKKSFDDVYAHTRIEQIDGEARVKEIARMLSGTATDASLAHARELLGL